MCLNTLVFALGDIQNCSVLIHVYLKWSKNLVRNNEKLNSLQNTHICGLAQATNFSTFKMLAKSFKLAMCYCVKHQLCVSMNVRWPMCNVCWVLNDICDLTVLANIRIRYSYNFYLVLLMQWALDLVKHFYIRILNKLEVFPKKGIC